MRISVFITPQWKRNFFPIIIITFNFSLFRNQELYLETKSYIWKPRVLFRNQELYLETKSFIYAMTVYWPYATVYRRIRSYGRTVGPYGRMSVLWIFFELYLRFLTA